MNLIHIYRMINFIKDNDGESLKEYAKAMTPEQTEGFRTRSKFLFWFVSIAFRYYLSKKPVPKGEPIPKAHEHYYKIKPLSTLIEFNEKVMGNQSDWNVLKLLDGKKDGMFLAVEKEHGTKFDGFEDALQWNTYYCTSLIRSREYRKDKTLVDKTINDLLIGIDLSITDKAIKRHPLESIDYDLESVSQDMTSGLIQLLLIPTQNDCVRFPRLLEIKEKVKQVFLRSDYRLMYPDGTVNSYDLYPNFIYNHVKCYCYIGLRMITGEYDERDRYIAQQMLRIPPFETQEPSGRSMYGSIVLVNAVEAICLNDRELLLDGIELVQRKVDSSYEWNAEIDSVMCSLYYEMGYKTNMEEYAERVLGVLSNMTEIGLEKNINNLQRDTVKGNHPRPPLLRKDDDWFWQRNGYRTGANRHDVMNMIEFSSPLARVLPTVYYPNIEER